MSIGDLAAIFGTSFLVSLTGALSPGPLTTLAVREGVRRGFWAGPVLAGGHGVIELALVIGLALGLNQLLDSDAVTAAVALLGGGFLLFMGLRTVITARAQELHIERDGPEASAAAGRFSAAALAPPVAGPLALAAMAVSLTNPFWVAWWATIGTAYIVKALDEGAAGVASFYTGHIIADLGWLSLIAFVLASGRRLMSRRAYQLVLSACGLFLLGLGGWFLASGVGYLV
ncbi:MAG: LysE family transporter [Dehalococcoidia bacterium]|nr:LysE family transporter [Dehalococcoidia bacterium]